MVQYSILPELSWAAHTHFLTSKSAATSNYFARQVAYSFLNIFAIRMAGVFIFSTCVIALRTGIFPRWIAFSGFACGLTLLLVISNWKWIEMLFPLWTILVSAHILAAQRKSKGVNRN